MEVKEAVKVALEYVADAFSDAGLSNLGLEEIMYDNAEVRWKVTVGFSRPWDYPEESPIESMVRAADLNRPARRPINRTYKVVEIRDSDGRVTAIRNREVAVDE